MAKTLVVPAEMSYMDFIQELGKHNLKADFVKQDAEKSIPLVPKYKLAFLSSNPVPERIIRSGPATIVLWKDGTKTVLKLQEGDTPDDFAAFCIAFTKKRLGSVSAIRRLIRKAEVEEQK